MGPEYLKHLESISGTDLYELMDQYGDDVWHYAYTMTKSRERAKDIAQEVFIKAHYKFHTYRGQSSVRTWLLAITRNVAINEMKSSYLRRVLLFGIVRRNQTAPSAEAAYMGRHSAAEIWDIIMNLSGKLREVLVLDLQQGLNVRETARLLNISEGTVKSRLHRARREVEYKMKEREP